MPAPIILQDMSGIAEGISSAGSVLGQALGMRMKEKRNAQQEQQYGGILNKAIDSLGPNPSAIDITNAMSGVLKQGVPMDYVQKYGTLYSTMKNAQKGLPPGPEEVDKMSGLFQKFGMDPEIARRNAELWGELTVGGQTEMAKYLVDQIARGTYSQPTQSAGSPNMAPGGTLNSVLGNQDAVIDETDEVDVIGDIPPPPEVANQPAFRDVKNMKPSRTQEKPFPDVKQEVFGDRTPKERTALKTELLKQNTPKYEENIEALMAAEDEGFRFQGMEELNNTDKLPTGAEAVFNVNWETGELRFPRAANAETQTFVKMVNDFTTKAKDSYGARVTNFELARFLKRLPTLANNKEGRAMILKQLKYATKINQLEAQSLKKVYDHYGVQGIDSATAKKIARDRIQDQVESIRAEAIDNLSKQAKFEQKTDAYKRTNQGYVPVRKKDGTVGQIPEADIDKAIDRGWEIL